MSETTRKLELISLARLYSVQILEFINSFSFQFVTFFSIGLSATTISPELFRVLGCDRPKYWSEVF